MRTSVVSPVFVGRRAELGVLDAAAARAREGHGGAVFLLGEAGIGKSRLGAEAAAGHGREGGRVVRGRAGSAPLRAVSEAVLAATRLAGTDLDPLGGFGPVLWRLVSDAAPAPDTPPDPPMVRAEAVLRLLGRCGRSEGCLLLLDDLHEADADTLAVVDYLVDNAAGEPVLVLGMLRPDPGPALATVTAAATRRAATVVELPPLDRQETALLAGRCVGAEVPAEVAELLARDAEGIPFIIEELIAAMVEDGSLLRDGDRWRATGDPRSGVPAPVTTAVLHRADRLGPGVTSFLQASAVLGRAFSLSTAAVTAGVTRAEALRCLRLATAARLTGPDAGEDPDRYAFRHALTADAMVAPLLPADRARLSATAAAAVEAGGGPQPPAGHDLRLAAELWAAADRPERAAACYARIGRQAVDRGAVATAVTYLERGLALAERTGKPELIADLLEARCGALVAAGDVVLVDALGDRLEALLTTLDAAPARRVTARLVRARAAAVEGDWERGLADVAAARRLAAVEPDQGERVALTAQLDAVAAFLCFGSTRPDRLPAARRHATAALDAAERTSLPRVACEALQVLVRCARNTDLPAAAGYAQRLLVLAGRHDLPYWRLLAAVEAATIERERSNDIGPLLAIRPDALDAGLVIAVAWIDFHLATAHLLRGDADEAQRCLARATEASERLRQPELQGVALAMAAAIAACRPDRAGMEGLLASLSQPEVFAHGAETWWHLRAICSWLEEEPGQVLEELAEADAAGLAAGHLRGTGHRSAYLFMRVARDLGGWAEYDELIGSPLAQMSSHRGLLAWSRAVLHGRDGQPAQAAEAVAAAFAAGTHTALNHHLAARVAAPRALAEGWGDPLAWLRDAEEFFHRSGRIRAGAACRALLREAGAGRQRRAGHDAVPPRLRRIGVTVREYDVLRLVAERLGNIEIAQRLFLSPRTVERHVGSLRQRTGQPDRAHLIAYARRELAG
ncbi:AAA family ATPase [Actinoplanes sp. NPDC049118]|uniref:helix-turn-helix transcriptional regulator n=1 Tax=Actinoplanes sp. NPDC049118 TaxID=3155769 RepID=UPI0033DB8C88